MLLYWHFCHVNNWCPNNHVAPKEKQPLKQIWPIESLPPLIPWQGPPGRHPICWVLVSNQRCNPPTIPVPPIPIPHRCRWKKKNIKKKTTQNLPFDELFKLQENGQITSPQIPIISSPYPHHTPIQSPLHPTNSSLHPYICPLHPHRYLLHPHPSPIQSPLHTANSLLHYDKSSFAPF